MKNYFALLFSLLFCQNFLFGQPCLTQGITFINQSEIDSFSIHYPNCTEIRGDVIISNTNITNLAGLYVLTSIGGNLIIKVNPNLSNLTGLDNVGFIGGYVIIESNNSLTSLSGLEGIAQIGGSLLISINQGLSSLSGLNNLVKILGDLYITSNFGLINLFGLEKLDSIGGELYIYNNSLTGLQGMDHLINIGRSLVIMQNWNLANLNGLGNLVSVKKDVTITYNDSLSSLQGPLNFRRIGGSLAIFYNDRLVNVEGINHLDSIGGNLSIHGNYALVNLLGLESVVAIFGHFSIYDNPLLERLTDFDNLLVIGGDLTINSNSTLLSLSGLDHINPNSINNVSIAWNNSLSICDIESICKYLSNPSGTIEIHDNAFGCNDSGQVKLGCDTIGIPAIHTQTSLLLYPNPVTDEFIISGINASRISSVTIINQLGEIILSILEPKGSINVSSLPNGFYQVEIESNRIIFKQKLIKNKM